jgi:hypothetical protein
MLPDDPSPQQIERLIQESSENLMQKNLLMHTKLLEKHDAMGIQFFSCAFNNIEKRHKYCCRAWQRKLITRKRYVAILKTM